ncbi:MAG: hypothetical protein WC972_00450 [Trueperaceae bacterium]|nr:hypothetical protein [Trueperaceae bacterium]
MKANPLMPATQKVVTTRVRRPRLRALPMALAALLLPVVLLAGCATAAPKGPPKGPPSGPPTVDVTGTWTGTWDSTTDGDGGVVADLQQSGSSLGGTVTITGSVCIHSGTVTGTISGSQVTFGVVNAGDTVQYSASNVTANQMTGTYEVTTGLCKGDEGTFDISK